jgi:pimeloyl-ACP methyl ester carboxylesterase
VAALAGCSQGTQPSALDRLKPCTGDDAPTDAYCGTLRVFENRATKQGRQIDLNIVVLPALSPDSKADPVFFLAGGPGQGAAKLARAVQQMFRRVQTDRDIVLVDQRGTGKSNPLDCESDDDSLKAFNEPERVSLDRLKKCMAGYQADLTQYTTPIAMDDLDDVRAHLGYERINIYGGSYGTRAGLVYMRQHGDRVRSAVLDGVAPTSMRLPLYFPRDLQRTLDLLVKDCEQDEPCRAVYPNLGPRIRELMARLEREPPLVKVTHPRTGETGEIRLEPRLVANVMAGTLYSPMASALLPAVVARAEQNDFQGTLALGSMGDGAAEPNMSVGMQLSVICAEDAPRVTAEEAEKESAGTIFGAYVMRNQRQACEFWPRGHVDPAYYDPIKSSIPTLVLSGQLDPVTPPVWGEQVAAHLTASRHVVIPGTGHTAGSTGCGVRIIRAFIDRGTTDGLDTTCAAAVHRPPFFVSPAGPDPSRAPAPSPASAPAAAPATGAGTATGAAR